MSKWHESVCWLQLHPAGGTEGRVSVQASPTALLTDRCGLTSAGIGVASLSWPPGQIVVEILTLLAVQALGVVVAHAVAVNLQIVNEDW